MGATAQVIDFQEARRRRAGAAETTSRPMPVMPIGWVPVWVFIPVWLG